jgi:chromosome segregation ATPase
MSTLNLQDELEPSAGSNAPLILRTILITILGVLALTGAGAGGYYYSKYEESIAKLDTLQNDITEIKREIKGANGVTGAQDDLKNEVDDLASTLDEIEIKIDSIGRDVTSIDSTVESIESDVGTIQLRIGY